MTETQEVLLKVVGASRVRRGVAALTMWKRLGFAISLKLNEIKNTMSHMEIEISRQ